MFDSTEDNAENKNYVKQPNLKKIKVDKLYETKPIHSSLEYTSIRAPPLVAYKSIDSYCENNRGKSLYWNDDLKPSTSGLKDLQSVSSPILLNMPKTQPVKKLLLEESMPYTFYTVEELSLVKSLTNWINTKVTAVGQVSLDATTLKCYLNSVQESGQWLVLLDNSLLEEIPKLQQPLQVYGTLTMTSIEPCIKVCFIRNLSWVDLALFCDSYKLMQKHVGKFDCSRSEKESQTCVRISQEPGDYEMNDTLDDMSFLL